MKISKRLKQIDAMVAPGYDHIWDCCCDHGLLGAQLLSRQAGGQVHFVDIVPDLMAQLKANLTKFYSSSPTPWQTHCMDVAKLPLQEYSGNHLVIIAGVGGDLIKELIEAINKSNPYESIDFLLCPVLHHYSVREHLRALGFKSKQETLIEDNRRYYEVQLVTRTSTDNDELPLVSLVGDTIWKSNCDAQQRISKQYLAKTLSHYKRIAKGNHSDTQPIIDAYKRVERQLASSML
ncbi:tRNA (adenine(22)-N(1))-methyltransferase TrmK [Vibrio lamellibrachiae]|uniref:tRNA (adenine(22)-N(1))-methyltransferase n=1 Tax=Vibrio lamellibrachiae TaxID=2910253 RepID=UPI003D098509